MAYRLIAQNMAVESPFSVAKRAIKDLLKKGAIKMRMVGALVLKWSQKVNGMTHKG